MKFAPPPTKFGPKASAQTKPHMQAGSNRIHAPPATRFGAAPLAQSKPSPSAPPHLTIRANTLQRMETSYQLPPPESQASFKNCIHYALTRLLMTVFPGCSKVMTVANPVEVSRRVMLSTIDKPDTPIPISMTFTSGDEAKRGVLTVQFCKIDIGSAPPPNSVFVAQMRGTPYDSIKAIRRQVTTAKATLASMTSTEEDKKEAQFTLETADADIAAQKERKSDRGLMTDDAHYFFSTATELSGVPSTTNTNIFKVGLRMSKKGDALKYEQHTNSGGENPSIGRVLGYLKFVSFKESPKK